MSNFSFKQNQYLPILLLLSVISSRTQHRSLPFPSAYLEPQIWLPFFLIHAPPHPLVPSIFATIFLLCRLVHSFILYLLPQKLLAFLPQSSFPYQENVPVPSSRSRALKRMDPIELKRVFQMFDRNGDGRITQKELNDSLESLGISIPVNDLRQMIEKIDVNGDGCVDMEEFGELYQSIMEERNEEVDMREAFDVFDQNGDGFITVEELRSVLSSLGLKQGRAMEDCKKMIMKVDVDGDGRVNYSEFKQMMKGGGFGALG